jgi:hypothetical protein
MGREETVDAIAIVRGGGGGGGVESPVAAMNWSFVCAAESKFYGQYRRVMCGCGDRILAAMESVIVSWM